MHRSVRIVSEGHPWTTAAIDLESGRRIEGVRTMTISLSRDAVPEIRIWVVTDDLALAEPVPAGLGVVGMAEIVFGDLPLPGSGPPGGGTNGRQAA